MFHFSSFPIPFPDSFTLLIPLYLPASFPFFSSPPHWTEPNPNPSSFPFPFSNFPYFTRVFRIFIPFWFQPYRRSSNKTESNWIENEKRKRGWKWIKKKSGKGVSPSRSLCYFPYFTWIQNQNRWKQGRWIWSGLGSGIGLGGNSIIPSQSSPAA